MLYLQTLPLYVPVVIVFFFGLIVGSFLNVLIVRMHTGKTLGGRSMCMSCQKTLTWRDLIPLVSFIYLRGRCRQCDARINRTYPFVEGLTGISFVLAWVSYGYSIYTVFIMVIATLLIVLSVYDWRHTIIPNSITYLLCGLGVLSIVPIIPLGTEHVFPLILDHTLIDHLVAIPLVAGPFFLIWLYSRGRWFGLGDVKLMIAMGLLLGSAQGIEAVFVAFWIAMLCIMFVVGYNTLYNMLITKGLVRRSRKRILKREIPFGPFLSASLFLSLIGIHVFMLFF